LDKITSDEKINTSRLKSLTLNLTQIEDEDKNSKEIHIPRIEDLFKNQSKEILIHENTSLRERLGKMINKIDQGINHFKALPIVGLKEEEQQRTHTPRTNPNNNEEDYEIDQIIERKLKKSSDLRDRLYKQKREMAGRPPGESSSTSDANNMSYFLREIEKPKRKEELKGVKVYPYKDGERNLRLTSASILLFEMNKLSN
jgi:hypothetical protein